MYRKWQLSLLPISVALVFATDQAWKDKQVAEWNADDAKQVLNDSPWAKTVKPTINRSSQSSQHRSGGGMGRGGGIGMGGIGIGLPGMGGGGAAEWVGQVEVTRVADSVEGRMTVREPTTSRRR